MFSPAFTTSVFVVFEGVDSVYTPPKSSFEVGAIA